MNENLKFEFCEPPAYIGRAGQSTPLTKFILEAPMDQWIKVSGYESIKEMRVAQTSINGAKGSVGKRLRREGITLKTRTDTQNLTLYVCKTSKVE